MFYTEQIITIYLALSSFTYSPFSGLLNLGCSCAYVQQPDRLAWKYLIVFNSTIQYILSVFKSCLFLSAYGNQCLAIWGMYNTCISNIPHSTCDPTSNTQIAPYAYKCLHALRHPATHETVYQSECLHAIFSGQQSSSRHSNHPSAEIRFKNSIIQILTGIKDPLNYLTPD